MPLAGEALLNNTQYFSPYLKEKKTLHYLKNEMVNAEKGTIPLYTKRRTKHMTKNAQLMTFKADGAYSYLWTLKELYDIL